MTILLKKFQNPFDKTSLIWDPTDACSSPLRPKVMMGEDRSLLGWDSWTRDHTSELRLAFCVRYFEKMTEYFDLGVSRQGPRHIQDVH